MKTNKSAYLKITETNDDGLFTSPIKDHSLDKYRAISLFLNIFSTGTKDKWQCRVYIDLFSGPGKSKIKKSNKIYPGSPLLALEVKDGFNNCIFSELNPVKFLALEQRVQKFYPDKKIALIQGDVNLNTEKILAEIPKASRSNKVLSLCLVDPFNVGSLKFSTIQKLNNE